MFIRKKLSLNRRNFIFSALLGLAALILVSCSPSYDLVISDGIVFDGTGAAPFMADIGIKDGFIRTIGNIKTSGRINIDAVGLLVAPGFIDIHTHCDRGLQVDKLKNAKNYLTQGVTTVVTGNCGGGTYQVEEFFTKIESQGTGPNVIHLVGHGTVRRAVMGQDAREPTPDELDEMKKLIAQAMEGGAAGFSTGLFYAPGSYAKTDEIVELARTVKDFDGIYASHIRDESNYTIGLKESIKEAIAVGEQAGVPVEISHIKALGKPVWGQSVEVCEIIENARKRGVRVYADQYPYMASSTGLSAAVIPRWVQAGGEMKNRLSDYKLLPRIKKEIAGNIDRRGGPASLVIVSFPKNRDFDGKNLLEISRMMKKPIVEAAIYLVLNGSPSVISFNMTESDLEYFMKRPYVMTGSDGNIQIPGSSFPHPRSYGTFTRKIRKYVIEDKILTMEYTVRAATALPAEALDLDDRGKLKMGFAADIVVFDPDEISDKATYPDPHQYSVGIQFLVINGEVAIEDGDYNGKLAGKPLRKNKK
jgi:N-acyl-D-aspartate/D-glutamate deacylase